jgi:hypothetical protein
MADYQSYKKIQGDQAIVANSIGAGQVTGLSTAFVRRDFYWNCCWWQACNGGCSASWTVPTGVQSIQFEITSGGGSGGPARCCMNGYYNAGSGAYATILLRADEGDFTPGSSTYCICAAGSSRCSENGCCNGRRGCGYCGCESYVTGPGLSNFCAGGGSYGHGKCSENCYTCKMETQCEFCHNTTRAKTCGMDWGLTGVQPGAMENQFCNNIRYGRSVSAPGPWGAGMMSIGRDKCSQGDKRGCCMGHSLFPGGGGFTGSTRGNGNCWGDWGQGGVVVVTYWS